MQPIQAGKLRHRVTINKPILGGTPDAYNAQAQSQQLVGTFWASVEPISGREIEVAKTYAATVSHKIQMRYVPGILTTYQLLFNGRTFNINAVLNAEERNRMLTLFVTEKIAT